MQEAVGSCQPVDAPPTRAPSCQPAWWVGRRSVRAGAASEWICWRTWQRWVMTLRWDGCARP